MARVAAAGSAAPATAPPASVAPVALAGVAEAPSALAADLARGPSVFVPGDADAAFSAHCASERDAGREPPSRGAWVATQ
eukprot:14332833-Alexandrium_andersonii.AAC.1